MRKSFQKALRDADAVDKYEALDRLEKMKLSDPAEYVARGQCLASANRYPAALDDFNAAISGDCKDPQAYFGLGEALFALGRYEEAVGALQKTVRLLPGASQAVYALCWELERLGRYDEAMGELRQYAKYDDLRNYSIYRHWGRICGKQKKWKSAYISYVKSVCLNPPVKNTRQTIRWCKSTGRSPTSAGAPQRWTPKIPTRSLYWGKNCTRPDGLVKL